MTDERMNKILTTEFSGDFTDKMKQAMTVSYYKYGPLSEGFPHKVDAVGSLMARLRKYADTGNTEWLVDVANFAMIEFMLPRHPKAHFAGTDGDASPGRRSLKTGMLEDRPNNVIGTNPKSKLAQFR